MADPPRGSRSKAKGKAKGGASGTAGPARSPSRSRTTGSRGSNGPAASSGARTPRDRASGGRNGISAIDVAEQARKQLAALLGRPIEAVLGVDRDHGNWVVKAQVVELARIPNTTDVLGEYEAVLDKDGDVVRFERVHRYHRGHVDSER